MKAFIQLFKPSSEMSGKKASVETLVLDVVRQTSTGVICNTGSSKDSSTQEFFAYDSKFCKARVSEEFMPPEIT